MSDKTADTADPPPPVIACVSCGATIPGGGLTMCRTCHQALGGRLPGAGDGDAEPVVVQDRICLSCGYRLDGLRSDRECPECGTPVARSLRGNLLRYSSPAYMRQLHVGMLLAELATCSLVVVFAVNILLAMVGVSRGLPEHEATFLGGLLGLAASTASLVGWWMFSAPDPAQLGQDTAMGARRLLRIVLVTEAVAGIAGFLIPLLLSTTAGSGDVVEAVTGIAMLVWLVRFVVSMLYLKGMALRFPDGKLREQAGRFIWLGPVVTLVLCGFGFLVAYIMYVLILDRARELLKQHRIAANLEFR
jgi:predicted RNA-binding Zn-ribbon protein involved in translation (DUF1610 family)